MKENAELTAKQDAAIAYMMRPESDGAAMLAFDMGLGKTRTGLRFSKEFGAKCVLAVVPLQTMDDWVKTAESIRPDLPVSIIRSDADGQSALSNFIWRKPGLYLITPQYWESKAWVQEKVKKRKKTDEDKFRKVDSGNWGGNGFLFIYDESHRTANVDSWSHRACMNLAQDVFKLAMSGTFMGDKFEGAYGATRWLWQHRTDIIPRNVFEWRKLWARTMYDKFAPRNEKVVGEQEEGAFVSALPCYIREETNIPAPKVINIDVPLYAEQRRVYDELDDKMVAWINDHPMTAEYDITKRSRQRQTTLAMPSLDFNTETGETKVVFDLDAISSKIDRLFKEMDGDGELDDLLTEDPFLILTDSQKFATVLTYRLNKRYGDDTAREWSGKVTKKRRAEVKADFIASKVRIIVGVQSAMGTGTDGLQYTNARAVVFMSRADRRIDNEQGIARLARTGQTQQVYVVNFLSPDTVDYGQASNQVTAAIAAAKSMRAKVRREEKERKSEQLRNYRIKHGL